MTNSNLSQINTLLANNNKDFTEQGTVTQIPLSSMISLLNEVFAYNLSTDSPQMKGVMGNSIENLLKFRFAIRRSSRRRVQTNIHR